MISDEDKRFMERAMAIAQKGEGGVNPNPLVGALLVKNGEIVAEGYHHKHGGLHAERECFKEADERGIRCDEATMYVTLEPCCHHGHQPPCTEAIIEHGVKRVVVGICDPNPVVAGGGIQQLRDAGIEVEVMADEEMVARLKHQNRVFLKYITQGMPWVTAKWAMTLDGKIATPTGDSRWITGEESRQYVHLMRRKNMAILCGIGTVLADNPALNVRLTEETMESEGIKEFEIRQPIRIVADRQARIPMESQLVCTATEQPLIVAYGDSADEEKLEELREAGVILWNCNTLTELMQQAAAEKVDSIMLESGGTLSEALLDEGLVDEVTAFIAPKIVGGERAKTPVEGDGIERMSEAVELTDIETRMFGKDIMMSGVVVK